VRVVTAADIDGMLDYPALVDALADAFRADIAMPPRHHHTIKQAGQDATMLIMPAWNRAGPAAPPAATAPGERYIGCKIATIFPDNAWAGRPSLFGQYLLMSGETGEPLAILDAQALTAWRTGAASALAARYLARPDAEHLVMVGAGVLAPHLVRAHAAVRPLKRVTLWNRSKGRAVSTAFALAAGGIETEVADDLEEAVRSADIVSCATLSTAPLIQGAWLRPGTHVDLVGSFTPKMREADDRALKRGRLYIDTRNAVKEAGDLVGPLRRKVISVDDIEGDLFELCRGEVKGRRTAKEITLFKSAGTAIEDFAAAVLVWRRISA
jgi:alanine dehydrogenase